MKQKVFLLPDFPDSLFDIPMDEKGHMRSLVDSVDVVQQPYLGMLNPTVDEMMLEPMDGEKQFVCNSFKAN